MLVLAKATWISRHSWGAGIAAGIIATVLVAAVVFLLQRESKTFDWQILTDEPILTGAAATTAGLKLTLHDRVELAHPRLITIRLRNSGKREIRPEDFACMTCIRTNDTIEIKSGVTLRYRDGMANKPIVGWMEHHADVSPVLYNRGDWADVQLIVDCLPDSPTQPTASDLTVWAVVAGQTRKGKLVEGLGPDGSPLKWYSPLIFVGLIIVGSTATTFGGGPAQSVVVGLSFGLAANFFLYNLRWVREVIGQS